MELWELNQVISDRAELALIKGFDAVEEEIFEILQRYMVQLEIKGGKFVRGQSSAKVINTLNQEISRLLQRVDLDDEVTGFLTNFDDIADNMAKLHKQQNGITIPKSLINSQKQFAIDATTFSLKESGVSMRFIDPVKRLLYSRVSTGAGLLDTEKALRTLVTGADGELGALSRWVGQVARDSVNEFEGAINQEVKSKYGMTRTRYVGSIVRDSRAQCVRWVKKDFIKDKELAKEIAWGYANGAGMKPDTTPETFSIKRGGYNCRHTAFPVK